MLEPRQPVPSVLAEIQPTWLVGSGDHAAKTGAVDELPGRRRTHCQGAGAVPDPDRRVPRAIEWYRQILRGAAATGDEGADDEPDPEDDERPRPIGRDELGRLSADRPGRAREEEGAHDDPCHGPRERPQALVLPATPDDGGHEHRDADEDHEHRPRLAPGR